MPKYKLNIFCNAIIARMEAEQRTAEDIIEEYTKLTVAEKSEILVEISRRLSVATV